MKCPNCDVMLTMSDRQGIEIDYCPQCRGVWLDRGELDKIIERSSRDDSDGIPAPPRSSAPPRRDWDDDDWKYKKKKKSSLLGEIFDFG